MAGVEIQHAGLNEAIWKANHNILAPLGPLLMKCGSLVTFIHPDDHQIKNTPIHLAVPQRCVDKLGRNAVLFIIQFIASGFHGDLTTCHQQLDRVAPNAIIHLSQLTTLKTHSTQSAARHSAASSKLNPSIRTKNDHDCAHRA